jgi:hypothetical protein
MTSPMNSATKPSINLVTYATPDGETLRGVAANDINSAYAYIPASRHGNGIR